MTSFNLDVETRAYINSDSEFRNARLRGFIERLMGFLTGHNMHLLSFEEVVHKLRLDESIYRGCQDIPLKNIIGSTGRYEEFTRHFFPQSTDKRDKERWRAIYTLAVTGKGFPPIEAYKIDQIYFVQDGNHRVSVAQDLGWKTIQAYVTELLCPITLTPDMEPDELLIKEECAYFLERTQLDKIRPEAKQHIDFTEPGGYQSLLQHILLHRSLLMEEDLAEDETAPLIPLETATAQWYDTVFMPALQFLQESDIGRHFPARSDSDLYMWLINQQNKLRRQYDFGGHHMSERLDEFLHFVNANMLNYDPET